MNIFSTPGFLEIAGGLFYPRRRRSLEVFRVEGRVLRLLVLDGRQVVRTMPFYDFPQPLELTPAGPIRELRFFPRTVLRTMPIEARPEHQPPGLQDSPYVAWAGFKDFAAYEALVAGRKGMKGHDSERQRRRLEREHGEVRFEFDDRRPEALATCVRWKSAQYLATGVGDAFAHPAHVELFRRLQTAGLVVVSTLSVKGQLIAAHLGSLNDRRLGWWIPSYDPAFQRYSPGRLLMLELLRTSFEHGHLEFDFLLGGEDYKFIFATHDRVVGPLGTRPLGEQLLFEARRGAKAWLGAHPRADALARSLRSTVLARVQRLRG